MSVSSPVSAYDAVPQLGTSFELNSLIEAMPVSRFDREHSFLRSQVAHGDLIYVLNALKLALGKVEFDSHVALRKWDVALVMLYSLPLTNAQLVTSLVRLKELFIAEGITMEQEMHQGLIRVCIAHLCKLHFSMSNWMISSPRVVPTWDDISPDMSVER